MNKRFTSVLLVPSTRPISSNIMFRAIHYFKQYMDQDVVIYTNNKDFSILPIFRYKPNLNSIMTKEEKAVMELHKKYVIGGTFVLKRMEVPHKSDDPYIHAIAEMAKRMMNFKEFKSIKDGEAYSFYHKNTEK